MTVLVPGQTGSGSLGNLDDTPVRGRKKLALAGLVCVQGWRGRGYMLYLSIVDGPMGRRKPMDWTRARGQGPSKAGGL